MMDDKMITQSKNKQNPFYVVLITLFVCLAALMLYLKGPLQANFDQFFLPAKKFGVPQQLQQHDIQVLFTDNDATGWDGQFYYYIANDPFARKDTIQHLDLDAYRYQRIGLPILAKVVSKVFLQSWVSPLIYYLTSLFLILFGTWMAAYFFKRKGYSPYLALLWSLGYGTQITLLNGLPDAAADGLLIIALVAFLLRWRILYLFGMIFAVLAREIYVLVPAFIIIALGIEFIRKPNRKLIFSVKGILNLLDKTIIHLIPIIIWISWQLFIRIKMGTFASAQAPDVLGWPLVNTIHYLWAALNGHHPIAGNGIGAYLEAICLILYLVLLGIAIFYLVKLAKKSVQQLSADNTFSLGIALAFLAIIATYFCFGPLVMEYQSGYFKAVNIFLFLIPFIAVLCNCHLKKYIKNILWSIVIYYGYLFYTLTLLAPPYTNNVPIDYVTQEPACLQHYNAQVTPLALQMQNNNLLKRILLSPQIIINTKIVNLSNQPFSPYPGKGSVNVSYQWLTKENNSVLIDGIRTTLTKTLYPNQSTIVPVVVRLPVLPGDYILKLSLVQDGCAWFYTMDPNSAFSLPYQIK